MAITPDKVEIGTSGEFLDGVAVDTAAGTGLFRETVVTADPENGEGLARVLMTAPGGAEYGLVVRVVGLLPDAHRVKDQFVDGQILTRQQAPTDTVLTFGFASPVDIVYVFSADHSNHTGSVDLFGGTPSATQGIPVLPGVPQSFPVRCQTVKVYANAGGEVTVWGYRYG